MKRESLSWQWGRMEVANATPERVALAEAEYVDPATLKPGRYVSGHYGPEGGAAPCVDCGHPRWAHAVPTLYWDGRCLVGVARNDACPCSGRAGYMPGVPIERDP